MSAFPNGFNPSIDRYDRRSAAHLFRWLWPEADVSLACARVLAASILVAHEAADASWEVSMFAHAIRLNVGQVEALTLTADGARFLFRAPLSSTDASPGEIEIDNDPYYSAIQLSSGVCIIAANDLPSLSAAVREAHNAYIRAAASFKRRSPFRKSFSPAVLDYPEEVLGESLPRPSYLPQQAATPRVAPLSEELDVSMPLWEGAKYSVTVNAYERNPVSRCRCIAHYGPTCVICGFNFGAVYSPLAEGFIHVHHIKPLSEIGKKYKVDPVADLRPVCPNCHGVIHLRSGCRSIEEVRQLLSLERKKGCGLSRLQ
jgi:5-methylcytosine-specific restriction enzyme A